MFPQRVASTERNHGLQVAISFVALRESPCVKAVGNVAVRFDGSYVNVTVKDNCFLYKLKEQLRVDTSWKNRDH